MSGVNECPTTVAVTVIALRRITDFLRKIKLLLNAQLKTGVVVLTKVTQWSSNEFVETTENTHAAYAPSLHRMRKHPTARVS